MQRLLLGWITALALAFGVIACGGGSDAAPQPGLLAGDPASPAAAALLDMAPEPADDADIVDGLMLTRLDVAITTGATVGQVNAALGSIGARIIAMRAGLPALSVAVPRQNGETALQALADTLRARPGIGLVLLPREAAVDVAPSAPPANTEAALGHLQITHFPAAWNARSATPGVCANNKVTVVVVDYFHRPATAPYADFAGQVPGVANLGVGSVLATDTKGVHGYNVFTTLAASLDNKVPTGANPFADCLDLKAMQLHGLTGLGSSMAIAAAAQAGTGKVIVNASYGFADKCGTPEGGVLCTTGNLITTQAFDRAARGAWQRALLQPDADRVLVVSAAGNNADKPVAALYPGTGQADVSSALNVAARADSSMSFASDAALWDPTQPCTVAPCFVSIAATPPQRIELDDLLTSLGQNARAPNVMIVGSVDRSFNRSPFSEPGADVLAVGEAIPMLPGGTKRGTSFAAPQVAGLAAYLWMLSPELRARPVRDTIAAIQASAASDGIVDAYTAVLALDQPVAPTPASARVRLAVLDIDGDGDFDAADLRQLRDAYLDASGQPRQPTVQDYSRFDLNGDGFTGGTGRTARMDLDPSGSTQFGARVLTVLTRSIEGKFVDFRENAVNDLQALCFYAYSGLYTAAAQNDARGTLLTGHCTPVEVSVSPGAATLSPGASRQFAAAVIGAENVNVAWTASGGTITPTGLFTAGPTTGSFVVRAIAVADPNAFADATVTVAGGGSSNCRFGAGSYALTGSLTRTVQTNTQTSRLAVDVTLCFDSTGRAVEITAMSGTSTSSFTDVLSDPPRTGSCTGTAALVVTVPPREPQLSRYSSLALPASGPSTSGNLFAATLATCQFSDSGSSTSGDVGPVGTGRHVVVGGRIVAIDFSSTSAEVSVQGRLEPHTP